MAPGQRITEARNRLYLAALSLAASVDVLDRLANDPGAPGDRSARADALRAEMRAEDLKRYREAFAALTDALRLGDCEACHCSLTVCRSGSGVVCCEDCTHPAPSDQGEALGAAT